MNKHDFDRIAASVEEAGKIRQGKLRPGRTTQMDPADIRSKRKGPDMSPQEPSFEMKPE